MSFKEFVKSMIKDMFIITTLVNITMFVLGSIYRPQVTLPYYVFLYPVAYGILGALPSLVLYSRKELSVKQLILRKVLSIVLLELLLGSFTFLGYLEEVSLSMLLSFAISVLVVYVLVNVIEWLIDTHNAVELMKELRQYQDQNR